MAYSKTIWINNSEPALDAAHLNNIETGIENVETRLTTAEASLLTAQGNIATNTSGISSLNTNLNTVDAKFNNAIVVRTGTFIGNWSPTLVSTFGITNNTDYNWVITLHQTSWSVQNGDTVALTGSLDVDNNTVNFSSYVNGTATQAAYTITGYKKILSNVAVVNQ